MRAYARLVERVQGDAKLLPQIGTTVSRNTFLTSVYLRALRDGREPIDSARAADIGYIPSTMSTELKLTPKPYITARHTHARAHDAHPPPRVRAVRGAPLTPRRRARACCVWLAGTLPLPRRGAATSRISCPRSR